MFLLYLYKYARRVVRASDNGSNVATILCATPAHCPKFKEMKFHLGELDLCKKHFNPFLFIREFSCPSSVQTPLTQNCLKLTIPEFLYNLFLSGPPSSDGQTP